MLRAGEWLRSIQNADGGWGESCSGDDHHTFVPAESTASPTAWAILGLLASGDSRSLSVVQGVEYLRKTRRDDGSLGRGYGHWDGVPSAGPLGVPARRAARAAGRGREVSTVHDGQHGRLHCPKQTPPAAGVAKEPLVQGGRGESVQGYRGCAATPDDRQAIPAGLDARTTAHLQLVLRRMRASPRVPLDDRTEADSRPVPGGRGRVRSAGRVGLRRRAASVPRDRATGSGTPASETSVSISVPTGYCCASAWGSSRRTAA